MRINIYRSLVLSFLERAAMIVVIAAGVLKISDLASFERSLSTWSIIPTSMTAIAALGVVVIELSIAVIWIGAQRPQAAAVCCWLLVVAITGVYVAQWIIQGPPECECFGKWLRYEQSREAAKFVLGRNIAILVALSPAIVRRGLQVFGRLKAKQSPGDAGVLNH